MADSGRDLLVLRHAKAERGDMPDFERPLARRGRKDAPRIAGWLRDEGLVPDLVVASPARRTAETTELVLEALGIDPSAVRWEERVYEAPAGALLGVLSGCPEECVRVLLVGHNPGAETLVRLLARTVREPASGKFLPTAALAHLRIEGPWSGLSAGCAELLGIVRPRDLDR